MRAPDLGYDSDSMGRILGGGGGIGGELQIARRSGGTGKGISGGSCTYPCRSRRRSERSISARARQGQDWRRRPGTRLSTERDVGGGKAWISRPGLSGVVVVRASLSGIFDKGVGIYLYTNSKTTVDGPGGIFLLQ